MFVRKPARSSTTGLTFGRFRADLSSEEQICAKAGESDAGGLRGAVAARGKRQGAAKVSSRYGKHRNCANPAP
ncbi:hypothetical protein V501_06760 [Pseudogymnoascus sp. VKM F-4519 (FW-2642)]|nr:hypothetical protein V501_06760 [Pseudogymnoascus sp. VKM F-4519 (FW-2642)]